MALNSISRLQLSERLPVLSEHRVLRYFIFVVLYLAQGIPEGMTFFAIPAWMAMNGKTPLEIGAYVGIIGLPWSFKILIAPLMDRFSFLPMGRRRPWVIFGQTGLIISFIALSQVPDPLHNLQLLTIAGFFVSFFGAFQDVATDGMAIDIVPHAEQARANGLMWGSKIIGTSTSLFVGNWIINNYSFSTAVLTLSLTGCIILMVPLLFRERHGERILPWTKGEPSHHTASLHLDDWFKILRSLFGVFLLPTSLFFAAGLFFIHIAIGLMDAMLPVFTIQGAGWTDTKFSQVFSVCNVVAGLLGMVAGGFLADHFNKKRMMTFYLTAMMVLMVVMAFLKLYWGLSAVIAGFIVTYYVLYVFLTIAIFATGMELCWKRVAASQFTLYMTIANLGRATGGGLLGPLKGAMDWEYVLLFVAGMAGLMLLLIQKLHFNTHHDRLENLESAHLASEKAELELGELQTDLPR
jgi:PAT family beta-lactamase induction signal transducer AmpG